MAKEIVAMILAGGRGSRLYALTQKTAKPAVSFGGKYRIVDFPLSNCVNSNIDTVGIATQYQPQKLNEYIGNGQPCTCGGKSPRKARPQAESRSCTCGRKGSCKTGP